MSEKARCAASTPAAALTGLYLVLQADHTGFARLGLLAALWQEYANTLRRDAPGGGRRKFF